MLEIRRLREFRTVVECGSLTRAAPLLHMTVGAISKSMRQLEQQTGRALFEKHGRGLRLTQQGSLLYESSSRLLEEHAHLLRRLDASATPTSETLHLVSFEVFTTHVLAALVDGPLKGANLSVLEQPVGKIERAVAEHAADIGITYMPAPRRGLAFEQVATSAFGIYCCRGAFENTPYASLPFAVPVTSLDPAVADVLAIDCWPQERIARHIRYRLTSLESALALCRRGHCAVFLPSFVAAAHNQDRGRRSQLVRQSSPRGLGTVTRPVHLVYRETDERHPRVRKMILALSTTLGKLAATSNRKP